MSRKRKLFENCRPDVKAYDPYFYHIHKTALFLEKEGLRVDLFSKDLPWGVGGRIHYNERIIRMNVPDAKEALMTIFHETGHWLSYVYISRIWMPPLWLREFLAALMGWEVNQWCGGIIPLADWAGYHKDAWFRRMFGYMD